MSDYNYSNLPEDFVLDSVFEIEDVLESIAELQDKKEYFKNLKKHRIETCDQKIDSYENKILQLRKVILETMKKLAPKDKTIDFSPIGKVTRKNPTQSWSIEDEDSLKEFLEKNKKKDGVVEVKERFIKRQLDRVLDELSNTIKKIPGVSLKTGEESVSIIFEKTYDPKDKQKEEPKTIEEDVTDEIESGIEI